MSECCPQAAGVQSEAIAALNMSCTINVHSKAGGPSNARNVFETGWRHHDATTTVVYSQPSVRSSAIWPAVSVCFTERLTSSAERYSSTDDPKLDACNRCPSTTFVHVQMWAFSDHDVITRSTMNQEAN